MAPFSKTCIIPFHFVGTPCISTEFPVKASYMRDESGSSTVNVSTGLRDDILLNVSTTLNCSISLSCLNCSFPAALKEQCTPTVMFNNVPDGNYTVNVTVSSDCDEVIVLGETSITIEDKSNETPTTRNSAVATAVCLPLLFISILFIHKS